MMSSWVNDAPSEIIARLSLLVFFVAPMTLAQQLLVFGQNALPICAQQCQLLSQAQAACIPPAAPVTNQATYESCFCQSGYLVTLKTNPSAACGTVCQGDDLTQIASWYTSNCADGGAKAAAESPANNQASTTGSGPTASSATATNPASTGRSQSSPARTTTKQTWWSQHWKWVMMIIIIFVLLALFAAIAVLIRRRYRKHQDKMKGRFNDGITSRAMTTVTPATDSMTTHDHAYGEGRATPVHGAQYSRNNMPVTDLERGRKLNKGKGRMQTQEDDIGHA